MASAMMPGRALRTAGWLMICLACTTSGDSALAGVVSVNAVLPEAAGGDVVARALPPVEAGAGATSALAGFKVAVVMVKVSHSCVQACGHHTGMLRMSS